MKHHFLFRKNWSSIFGPSIWLPSSQCCLQVVLNFAIAFSRCVRTALMLLINAPPPPERNKRVQGFSGPTWARSWANFSLLQRHPHRNAWANWHLLGQPNTLLALGHCFV